MRTVAFFNNKGGVGKTSLVSHLAWMFADRGVPTLAADLDPQSNRIGVRLSGSPIEAAQHTLASRPMVQGAVQLPPNGLPIILGPDHPTTGGYPVVAVVTARSMSQVAQWSGGPRHFGRA